MSELPDVPNMLAEAERAAMGGDLASADTLLQGVARIQEAELGPLHPELANTLNNLAVIAETTGRLGDAETFYRRAVAITSESLPADDPVVATSRKNLEDFCRAQGLPIDTPTVTTPHTEPGPPVSDEGGEAKTPIDLQAAEQSDVHPALGPAAPIAQTPPPPAGAPPPVLRPPATIVSDPLPPGPRPASRSLALATIGIVVVVSAALLIMRPWSSREASAPAATAGPTAQPAERAQSQPSVPAPIEQPQPTKPSARKADRDVAADKPAAPRRSSDGLTLATVELCRGFSTNSGKWRCDPAGDTVPPGAIVLYTRVKSPRDVVVVHRWYRGDSLRQSVRLSIRANATEGYRTYSRQTVDRGAEWRVEVRSAAGDLLHEQRFAVR